MLRRLLGPSASSASAATSHMCALPLKTHPKPMLRGQQGAPGLSRASGCESASARVAACPRPGFAWARNPQPHIHRRRRCLFPAPPWPDHEHHLRRPQAQQMPAATLRGGWQETKDAPFASGQGSCLPRRHIRTLRVLFSLTRRSWMQKRGARQS